MYKNPVIQRLCNPLHKLRGIEADVLRLDRVHPVISGNKWFKLKYFISAAISQRKAGLVSFGGTYSNHLVAMAHACSERGLEAAAFIRGEPDFEKNESLMYMKASGMKMMFVSRSAYRDKAILLDKFLNEHPDFYPVPEGGQGGEGIRGAQEILSFDHSEYTDIFCPVGTGTTLAGIINASHDHQRITGISALKVANKTNNELLHFLKLATEKNNYRISFNFHFGGYAGSSTDLLEFMNNLYRTEQVPTDFVYTGKMFFAVEEMIKDGILEPGSRLLVIHTGGLQGNRSLAAGELIF